jgi:DNA-binding response OmpR family regulator/tRNA A-37 threonylcarbamoyl transferase component Bud32
VSEHDPQQHLESGSQATRSAKHGERPHDEEAVRQLRHDLRTPLNQILGYSEMLQEEAEELERPSFAADLQKIEQAGRRLLELVDSIALPTAPAPSAADTLPTASRRLEAPSAIDEHAPATGGRILVVDDNEMNRDMLSRRLSRKGYEVQVAEGGREALELVKSSCFDCVLLDVMMPEVGGIEVLETVRRSHGRADLPIIMATARTGSEDIVDALERGANDYVTKPLDFAVVLARLGTQLDLKRARDQVQQLNRRLADAQKRIGDLVESSANSAEDIRAWTKRVAAEVAAAIGAADLTVWFLHDEQTAMVTGAGAAAPPDDEEIALLRRGEVVARRRDSLVPVAGVTGDLFGALAVSHGEAGLDETASGLVRTFSRHLGSTLELDGMRGELAEAAERRRAKRQDLLEQGIDLLSVCPSCGRCYDQDVQTCEEDGAELESSSTFPLLVAGRYLLERRVGEGAIGTVFRAHDQRLDRDVAVKVIKPEHFHNAQVRERFAHEARLVARIDHPGVVAALDSGEIEDDSLYIVMEWLGGNDLGELLSSQGPGSPTQVAELVTQAAAALEAAHRVHLIHRDIKPDNLFLVADAAELRVKVLDFGVAKELLNDVNMTTTGTLVGTPVYMSPEQLLGGSVDARSDLYSLACVAFRALTGERTVRAKTLAEVVREVIDIQAPLPSSVLEQPMPQVDEAFRIALAKDPAERPSSVAAWAQELEAALAKLPASQVGWSLEASSGADSSPKSAAPADDEETLVASHSDAAAPQTAVD